MFSVDVVSDCKQKPIIVLLTYHAERISLKLAVEYLKKLGRGTHTEICCDCGYVNVEDNFMKFTQQVLQGVNCGGQKDFSPGGTHGG